MRYTKTILLTALLLSTGYMLAKQHDKDKKNAKKTKMTYTMLVKDSYPWHGYFNMILTTYDEIEKTGLKKDLGEKIKTELKKAEDQLKKAKKALKEIKKKIGKRLYKKVRKIFKDLKDAIDETDDMASEWSTGDYDEVKEEVDEACKKLKTMKPIEGKLDQAFIDHLTRVKNKIMDFATKLKTAIEKK